MPHKDGEEDDGSELRPSERRHRSKTERDSSRPRKKSSRTKVIDPETGEPVKSSHRRKKEKDESEISRSMADVVPELSRTAASLGATSRSSLPYPSFNKAYSKEDPLNSKENVSMSQSKPNPYPTPDQTLTDLGADDKYKARYVENPARSSSRSKPSKDGRPPSPPDTEILQQKKATPSRIGKFKEDVEAGSRSWFGRKGEQSTLASKSKASKANVAEQASRSTSSLGKKDRASIGSQESEVDSNATRKAAPDTSGHKASIDTSSSPTSASHSSPRTPTQSSASVPPIAADIKPSPSPYVPYDILESRSSANDSPYPNYGGPPPPPPAPSVPINPPRVDYLMQNGGLLRLAPKTLLNVRSLPLPSMDTPRSSTPVHPEIQKIFGPISNVLDQYETVMNNNGSLAVATGYRSVARRLLDKLGNVFARDLSSEGCHCVMCQRLDLENHEVGRGLGWGEVLEWVSGRRELPVWPAFDFASMGIKSADALAGLGLSNIQRPGAPVEMDPDIAEEFREHYLQQSKKTKKSVDRWLSDCPETSASPPQEVDDETLSFAILTHLHHQDRPIYSALLSGSKILQPLSRAPTPLRKARPDFMVKTVQSIQRLYRLAVPPRDPEAAIYLLKNPELHDLLATLAEIVPSEWEILISGRFDGFLWSGADTENDDSPLPSRGPTPLNGFRGPSPAMRMGTSRNNTPFSPMRSQTFSPAMSSGNLSRGSTPSQHRHPVSNDEETEIAVLAEIEREIYLSMETLEDAFEALHRKAEYVRQAIRQRGAGLSMSSEARRSSQQCFVSPGTPGSQFSGMGAGYVRPDWEGGSESDWDTGDDGRSEIAPDDSASNISSSRHRRPKRRNERRTPALIEEDED